MVAVTRSADSMSLFVMYWWHASIENMSESASSILGLVLLMCCFAGGFLCLWGFVLIFWGIMSLNPHITMGLFLVLACMPVCLRGDGLRG